MANPRLFDSSKCKNPEKILYVFYFRVDIRRPGGITLFKHASLFDR